MCGLCEQNRSGRARAVSRRSLIKATAGIGLGASLSAVAARPAAAQASSGLPAGIEAEGARYVIRGGVVLSMDPAVGDFPAADVLVEGGRIVEIAPAIDAGDAPVIEAAGRILIPGFIDTHHHQFETALRGFLADGILFNDGKPENAFNYFETILARFAPAYRPEDVYINELFAGLSQLDAGVTTVLDVSQIHHSPEHSDAAYEGLRDAGRRAAFGYFEGQGRAEQASYPEDARRLRSRYFSSDDQLMTMVMGGELYMPTFERSWELGRELGLPIAAHVVGGMPNFAKLVENDMLGPDFIAIHMSRMSDTDWAAVRDNGVHVSIAAPIEMAMRHGMPPILKVLEMGLEPSLSTDVECTMTADFFTQMRSVFTLQRSMINEMTLDGAKDAPPLLTSRDVLRYATINGATGLGLDHRTGSLTPGKQADIVMLDATMVNAAPLNNAAGAIVTLMDRSNVETVIVGGVVRKWKGQLLGVDLDALRGRLDASRDYLFATAGIEQNLFR
jgi:cytosine/adenosine deaminase-related metal-dependent hydrolase